MTKTLLFLTFCLAGRVLVPAQNSPELLAGLSSELPEFATTATPDGQFLYFNRTNADRSKIWIMQSVKRKKGWQKPVLAPFCDTTFREVDPFVSPDGRRLFFSSTRPETGREAKDFDLWFCEKTAGGWSAPRPLGAGLNTGDDEIFCTASAQGNLYFTRFTAARKARIFRTEERDGAFGPPERVLILHDTLSTANPAISPDERWLVFFSRELGGYGNADLFACERLADGSWAAPVNLGATVNTTHAEFAPAFSPDGKFLFFTSERPGVVQDFPAGKRRPGDLYRVDFEALRKNPEFIIRQNTAAFSKSIVDADWAAVTAAYTLDAKIFPHRSDILRGPEAIRGYWTPPADRNTRAVRHRILSEEIVVDGREATDWGYYEVAYRSDDGQESYHKGKYVVVWRETGPGVWKMYLDIWNSLPAP